MMRLLSGMYEVWLNLSLKTKVVIVTGLVGLVLGIPTSERALAWRWFRQGVQSQNCIEDATKPILSAEATGDPEAVERAVSSDRMRDIRKCGDEAIKRPKGSVSFLLDEYRRKPAP
ncbi:hypothetical protein [Burkholderia sp. BCC1977]|uniref:hypothetical protein n=1 Tax=Burkholderia sp. BCC1977 TaxID=2817440 RepID=UPI002ABE1ACD|nr:hypothetical protein [Burkholderia sp. BCC1977]